VVKGHVSASTPDGEHKVDGLSGATMTSNGVTRLVRYWFSSDGYEPYLRRLEQGGMAHG
jgi:Na+-transporting NADH:ubiquinone oxidoreductase subunit C